MPDQAREAHATTVMLDGSSLSIGQVHDVARLSAPIHLQDAALARVQRSFDMLAKLADGDHAVYGVNTGFGIFASRKIPPELSRALSRNLVLSHAVGLGEPYPDDVVRAAMLIRINSLASGHSGVDPTILTTLMSMLNKNVVPVIPQQGSLGSSGDLAPLAHLALVLSSPIDPEREEYSGEASFGGTRMSGKAAMEAAGISRPHLGPKQGLALINGATFTAAMLALATHDTGLLISAAEAATALTFEALFGIQDALDERLHHARRHPGQMKTARHLKNLLSGSEFSGKTSRVQDPYSLRCAPQILGPAWETLAFVEDVVGRELNAATDNPLLFDDTAISGGNFHGQPLGLCADYLKIALSELAAVAERRIFKLLSGEQNIGLPMMLVADEQKEGFHSGLMMLQYTAASLVLENQHLAAPDSIHSLPTSAGQEDHNANSTSAARHLMSVIANATFVIAIEMISAAQAIRIRHHRSPELRLGEGTAPLYEWLCSRVPFISEDRPLSNDVEHVAKEIMAGSLPSTT